MEKTIRTSTLFYRKYAHAIGFYGKKIFEYIGRHIAKCFFYFFPSAHHAFKKRDRMAGLTHGPSSFFLHKISEGKRVAKKRKGVLE
jgi:hypothetical protein